MLAAGLTKRVLNNEGLCAQRLSDNDAAYGLIRSSLSVDRYGGSYVRIKQGQRGSPDAGRQRVERLHAVQAADIAHSALAVGCKAPETHAPQKFAREIRFAYCLNVETCFRERFRFTVSTIRSISATPIGFVRIADNALLGGKADRVWASHPVMMKNSGVEANSDDRRATSDPLVPGIFKSHRTTS